VGGRSEGEKGEYSKIGNRDSEIGNDLRTVHDSAQIQFLFHLFFKILHRMDFERNK